MECDNISPPGSWREEILKGPATTTQLREIIAELEQSLRTARYEYLSLKEQNHQLVTQLTHAVASEMELRARLAASERFRP